MASGHLYGLAPMSCHGVLSLSDEKGAKLGQPYLAVLRLITFRSSLTIKADGRDLCFEGRLGL